QAIESGAGLGQRIAIELAGGGDESHLELPGTATLTHDQIAQPPFPAPAVIGGQSPFTTPGDDFLAGLVGRLGGEEVVLDLHDLVPPPRSMKAALKASGLEVGP